ncbi:hypothetical protein NUACC21_30170 [Scytonema sp. NUACC21]
MPLLNHFDPPANLTDFDAIPGHREAWNKYISDTFDRAIKDRIETPYVGSGKSQYYNETKVPSDDPVDLEIVWDAFPKTLTRQFGREKAFEEADKLSKDNIDGQLVDSRQQDEYCEWQVTRDPKTNKILRVIFTCEGPEYWQSMFGGKVGGDGNNGFEFKGDQQVLLDLYRSILNNQDVKLEDLFFADGPKKGEYNFWNKWNTTEGIVHLQQRNNTLAAEIFIGADATIRRKKGGKEITEALRLICCGGFGGVERSSDPTIGDEVNKLARAGYAITLRNPVGIYFHSFDNAGFTKPGPGGSRVPAGNYLTALRGIFKEPFNDGSNMIVRAVYEVPTGELGPDGEQLTVSDIQIGGEEIVFGGQIAERIKIKFVGRATRPGQINNPAFDCETKCCRQNRLLRPVQLTAPCEDVFPETSAQSFTMEAETPVRSLPKAFTRSSGLD